jgi:hypothetical protein
MTTSRQSWTGRPALLANATVIVWTLYLVCLARREFFLDRCGTWVTAIFTVWVVATCRWRRFPPRRPFWQVLIGQRLTLFCCIGMVVLLPIPRGWWMDYPNHSAFLLEDAAGDGDLAEARKLLDAGVAPNFLPPCPWCDDENSTPLCAACWAGHAKVVALLLDRGANIEMGDALNYSPLEAAATEGHVDVVRLLLRRGARVAEVTTSGHPPSSIALRQAALEGQEATVEVLLRHGANANQRDDDGTSLIALVRQVGTNPTPMISLLRRCGGKG